MKNLNLSIRDLVFSSKCSLCRARHCDKEPYLCYNCYKKIEGKINLQKKEDVYYVTHYDDEIKRLITSLKLRRRRYLVKLIGRLIRRELLEVIEKEKIDIVIPVPVSSARERDRGYNQVEEILDYIGVEYKRLKRVKNTLPMHSLKNEKLRVKNILGSFESKISVKGKRILIVDDIVTTGSTIREVVKSLEEDGSSKKKVVFTFALARTALASDLAF